MAVSPSLEEQADLDAYGPTGHSAWRDVDWASHQRWLKVSDRWVNLVDIGSGPVVMLVHGLGANWQCWLENICPLAESRRVIALDLPGFGHSEMPVDGITIKCYGRCVHDVLAQLEVESAALVGSSMGGFVSAETAINFPGCVERLVLVAPAALWNECLRAAPLLNLEKIARGYVAWLFGQWETFHRRPRLRAAALKQAGVRYPLRLPAELTWELMSGTGKPGFSDALHTLGNYKIRDRLPEIDVPTLVVWGEDDTLVPLRQAAEYEELISNSRGVVYKDTGHLPLLERPARFNADVIAFLDEEPGASEPEPQPRTFAT